MNIIESKRGYRQSIKFSYYIWLFPSEGILPWGDVWAKSELVFNRRSLNAYEGDYKAEND